MFTKHDDQELNLDDQELNLIDFVQQQIMGGYQPKSEPQTEGEAQTEDKASQNKKFGLEAIKEAVSGEKIQLTLSDFLVPSSLKPDPRMGIAVLRLMSDWSWMTRRVEKIQIIADGQTRRRLSFDFTLPPDPGLAWVREGHELGTIVPLTFLRKGPLVNLDIKDHQGASLPVLSREENAEVAYQAIRLLVSMLELDQAADGIFGEDWDNFINSVFPEESKKTKLISWSDVIDKAIYSVIMSEGYDQEAVNYKKMTRLQDGHRYDLFSTAAQLCAIYGASPKWKTAPPPHQITFPSWLLGYDNEQSARDRRQAQEQAPRVLDSSPCIQVLACTILSQVIHLEKEKDFDKLALLEVLCQLLALTSTSFLFPILVKSQDGPPPRKPSRQLVKFGCDVETDRIESSLSSVRWFPRTRRGLKWVASFVLPRVGTHTLIRHSKWSAKSTHLEFQPPSQTRVTQIVAAQGRCLAEARGFNDPEGLGVSKIKIKDGKKVLPHSRQDLFEKKGITLPERVLRYRHGSYRTSQGSVHVTSGGSSGQAIDSLRFTIMPDLSSYQPLLASGAAICVTILSWIISLQQRHSFNDPEESWFTFSVFIASETIILAIFGALLLTTGHNRTAQAVWAGPRRLMTLAAIISVLSPFLCLSGIWHPYRTAKIPQLGHINDMFYTIYKFTPLIIVSLLGYSVLLLFLAVWMQRQCWDNGDSAREERIIEEKVFPRLIYRPYHNVVAVTETGVGNCAYLTDDFVRYFNLAPTLTDYRDYLTTTVREMLAKHRRIWSAPPR